MAPPDKTSTPGKALLEETLCALIEPFSEETQFASLFLTAISNSQNRGEMSSLEETICKWLIPHILDTFRRPYKMGFDAGFKAGMEAAAKQDAFRNQFKDLLGYEWPQSNRRHKDD